MVPLDRALVSSYRLSIVAMSLTAAVWPQFATQVFRGGMQMQRLLLTLALNVQCFTLTLLFIKQIYLLYLSVIHYY